MVTKIYRNKIVEPPPTFEEVYETKKRKLKRKISSGISLFLTICFPYTITAVAGLGTYFLFYHVSNNIWKSLIASYGIATFTTLVVMIQYITIKDEEEQVK